MVCARGGGCRHSFSNLDESPCVLAAVLAFVYLVSPLKSSFSVCFWSTAFGRTRRAVMHGGQRSETGGRRIRISRWQAVLNLAQHSTKTTETPLSINQPVRPISFGIVRLPLPQRVFFFLSCSIGGRSEISEVEKFGGDFQKRHFRELPNSKSRCALEAALVAAKLSSRQH